MATYDDTVECVVNWQFGPGQGFAKNILHLFTAGPTVDQDAADAVAAALADAFTTTDWKGGISTDILLRSIVLKDLRTEDQPSFESAINENGDEGGHALPAQIALVTTLRTAVGSRRGRGRIYGYGYTEASNTVNGTCDPTTALGTQSGWRLFQTNLLESTFPVFDMGVLSKLDGVTRPVTGITTDTEWDTQRRRRS